MTASTMPEQIAAVLDEHRLAYIPKFKNDFMCSCDHETWRDEVGYRQHLAAAVAELVADAQAKAWAEGHYAGYDEAVVDEGGEPRLTDYGNPYDRGSE